MSGRVLQMLPTGGVDGHQRPATMNRMKTRHRLGIVLFVIALDMALGVDASVILDVANVDPNNQKRNPLTWVLTDLNNTNPTAINPVPLNSGDMTAIGTFEGAGTYEADESFSLSLTASASWDRTTADANEATFDTYIADIQGQINIYNGAFTEGGNSLTAGQAVFFTVDTDNVSGEVEFKDMNFNLTGGSDSATFLLWDFETKSYVVEETAKSSNLTFGPGFGTYTLTTGDIGVIAANSGDFRPTNFTIEIGIGVVPEPSTLILIVIGGLLVLWRRYESDHRWTFS
jgi:hypothetical protein